MRFQLINGLSVMFFPRARRSHDKVGDYIAASAKFGGHGTAECDKEDLYVKPLLA